MAKMYNYMFLVFGPIAGEYTHANMKDLWLYNMYREVYFIWVIAVKAACNLKKIHGFSNR